MTETSASATSPVPQEHAMPVEVTSFECLARRCQAMEETHMTARVQEAPSRDRPLHGCPLLSSQVAEQLVKDTASVKERRDAREEPRPMASDDGYCLCACRLWIEHTLEACAERPFASSRARGCRSRWASRCCVSIGPTQSLTPRWNEKSPRQSWRSAGVCKPSPSARTRTGGNS